MANITNKMRYFIATLALLVVSGMACCQEMFVEFPYGNNGAIVRHVDDRTVLIYTKSKTSNYFFLVDLNNPSPAQYKMLKNDKLKVYDFEIFGEIVFFCGVTDETDPHAMFGYFPIIGFPSGDVYVDSVKSLRDFKKLDVFSVEDQPHVVMTADRIDGFSSIVDVRHVTGHNWQYDIVKNYYPRFKFDDVAVTDSFVVFTSQRINDYTLLWYFPKPPVAGLSLFYNTSGIDNLMVRNFPYSPVYITHKSGDQFETASNFGYDNFTVDAFDGIGYLYSDTLSKDTNDYVVDIRYQNNLFSSVVPIVNAAGTLVYSIQMAPVPVYTMANQVYPHVIQSIDKIPGGARSVSVGYDLGQDLNLYILDHIRPSYCAPAIEKRPVVVTLKKNRFETDIVLETVYNLFRKQTYETGITSNEIICPRITD